jgi:16S rRNA (guanine527-N7)-methyltransferase
VETIRPKRSSSRPAKTGARNTSRSSKQNPKSSRSNRSSSSLAGKSSKQAQNEKHISTEGPTSKTPKTSKASSFQEASKPNNSKSRFKGKNIQKPHSSGTVKRFRGTPSKKLLKSILEYHGVVLEGEPLQKLWGYHQLLREHNTDSDLSRLHSFETIVQRHYADCMLVRKYLKKGWPTPLLDVGSGAGFPGIMIKILSPETHITLAEPRPRRVDFLNKVIDVLELPNIEVFGHKVTSKSFTRPIQGVTCRAFASIRDTIPRIDAALVPGGKVLFMKGPAVKEELAGLDISGYTVEEKHFFTIPHTTQHRSLIVMKKSR